MDSSRRFSSSAGIAIGPILFVLAILAALAMAMSSGNGNFQVASNADRISADIGAQANLIRSTISQCNLQYSVALSLGSASAVYSTHPYPDSDASGSLVSSLLCDPMGTTSLWSDKLLPPPTAGFNPWKYVNAGATGGRCIWTTPMGASPKSSIGTVSGLTNAARKFNSATSYSASGLNEVIYNPASDSQKFVVWITTPSGTPDSNCLP